MATMRGRRPITSAVLFAICAATLALWAWSYKFSCDLFKNSVWDHNGHRVALRGSQSDFACTRVQWRLGVARGRLIISRSVGYSKNEFRPERITNYLWISRPSIGLPDLDQYSWSLAGFGATHDDDQTRGKRGNIVSTYHIVRLKIPCWAIALLFAALPAYRIGVFAMQSFKRRRKPGVCALCGYDLRASSHRCPECGTIPAHNTFQSPAVPFPPR